MPGPDGKAMLNRRLSLGASAVRLPPGGLLAAPLVLYLIVFYAYPVRLMLSRSVYEKGWTLEGLHEAPAGRPFLARHADHQNDQPDRYDRVLGSRLSGGAVPARCKQ